MFNRIKYLPNSNGIDTRFISFSEENLIMRRRILGMVDIVDKHDYEKTNSKCMPIKIVSEQEDVHDWFDSTILSMLNICSHILIADDATKPIAQKLIDFVLAFHHDKTSFEDDIQYASSMKFLEFHKRQEPNSPHYVPNFVIDDMKDLSGYLYKQFESFYDIVKKQENQLIKLNEELIQCNKYMEIAETPLINLMNSEKTLYLQALQDEDNSKLNEHQNGYPAV